MGAVGDGAVVVGDLGASVEVGAIDGLCDDDGDVDGADIAVPAMAGSMAWPPGTAAKPSVFPAPSV